MGLYTYRIPAVSGPNSGFVFPSFGTPHAGIGHNLIKSDLNELRARGAHGVVVSVSLLPRNDELVRESLTLGQALYSA